MIKIFSNKTTTQKITIQSKFLKNKTTILNPNSSNKVNDVKSDTLLFVQIHVQCRRKYDLCDVRRSVRRFPEER